MAAIIKTFPDLYILTIFDVTVDGTTITEKTDLLHPFIYMYEGDYLHMKDAFGLGDPLNIPVKDYYTTCECENDSVTGGKSFKVTSSSELLLHNNISNVYITKLASKLFISPIPFTKYVLQNTKRIPALMTKLDRYVRSMCLGNKKIGGVYRNTITPLTIYLSKDMVEVINMKNSTILTDHLCSGAFKLEEPFILSDEDKLNRLKEKKRLRVEAERLKKEAFEALEKRKRTPGYCCECGTNHGVEYVNNPFEYHLSGYFCESCYDLIRYGC